MSSVKELLHDAQREHPNWFEQSDAPELHEQRFNDELAFAAEMEAAQQQPYLWRRRDIPVILSGEYTGTIPPHLEREVIEAACVLADTLDVGEISYRDGVAGVTVVFQTYREGERILDATTEMFNVAREKRWLHLTTRYTTSSATLGDPTGPSHTAHTVSVWREPEQEARSAARPVVRCRMCGFEGASVNGFAFGSLCYECATELC